MTYVSDNVAVMSAPLFRAAEGLAAPRRRVPFAIILVCIWAIPAVLAIIETYTFARMAGRPFTLGAIVLRESATWVTYAAFTPLIFRMADRFPFASPVVTRRLVLHLLAATMIGAVAAAAGTVATRIVQAQLADMSGRSTSRIFLSWFLGGLPVALLSYFAVIGVAHAIRYFREAQGRREDALRLETQLADARLAALQGRLHPHFLYNTLNAVTVLVRDGDIVKSTRMLELLSEMLRRVLDRALPQVVPLRTELTLLRQYLEIEEVRFSDRLTVTVNVDEDALDAGVPTLVTQPLAENAIRHAVAHTSRPVVLVIAARVVFRDGGNVLEISVEDDGPGLAHGWERRRAERTGLSATAMRLTTLYGAKASLSIAPRAKGGTVSLVRLPYVRAVDTGPSMPTLGQPDAGRGLALTGDSRCAP